MHASSSSASILRFRSNSVLARIIHEPRSRAESRLVLRTLSAGVRRDMAQIRGWPSREQHNNPVPSVELQTAPSGWQEGLAPDLGQRKLAYLQGGQTLARDRKSTRLNSSH